MKLRNLRGEVALFVLAALSMMATGLWVQVTANHAKIEAPNVLTVAAPLLALVTALAAGRFVGFKQGRETFLIFTWIAAIVFIESSLSAAIFFWNTTEMVISAPLLRPAVWLPYIMGGWALTTLSFALTLLGFGKWIRACRDL